MPSFMNFMSPISNVMPQSWQDSFSNFMMGQPERFEQFQRYNPQQQQGLQQMLSQGLGGMQGMQPYQPQQFNFAPIAQQAQTRFSTQTVPSILERLTGMGGGAQTSSALGQQLGAASSGLSEALAALEAQYSQQQQGLNLQGRGQDISSYQNLLNMGMQQPFDYGRHQAQPGLLQSLLPQAARASLSYFGGGF